MNAYPFGGEGPRATEDEIRRVARPGLAKLAVAGSNLALGFPRVEMYYFSGDSNRGVAAHELDARGLDVRFLDPSNEEGLRLVIQCLKRKPLGGPFPDDKVKASILEIRRAAARSREGIDINA